MDLSRRLPRPTRPAVIYVATMATMYLVFGVFGVFGAIPIPAQNIVGAVFVIGTLPAGLVVIPLYIGISLMAGNVFLIGDAVPFLMEFMLALAVILNALVINIGVRRRRLAAVSRS